MEQFSEDHSKLLLNKEWLSKVDAKSSTPYLFKFHSSPADLTCVILLTDTKSVWTEVITSNILARRWRDCNQLPVYPHDIPEEDKRRSSILEILSKMHTLGGITDFSFDSIPSNYSDLSIQLELETIKWRWETCFLGHTRSAEIISQHLIYPLISLNHLAFSSSEPVNGLTDSEIEKAVDKVGRTARRTLDTHIKNTLSRPRVATALRRMTAIFNFVSELPVVVSSVDCADLVSVVQQTQEAQVTQIHSKAPIRYSNDHSHSLVPELVNSPKVKETSVIPLANLDSATESEDEGPNPPNEDPPIQRSETKPLSHTGHKASDTESSPPRPIKKARKSLSSSDEEDSEEERKNRIALLKSGASSSSNKRGTRQPIKRRGKRF